MDAQMGGGSTTTTSNNNNSNSTLEGSTGAAMPNPWGSPSASTSTNNTASSSSTPSASATPNATANPWGAMPGMPGMGAMPGMGMPPGMPNNMDPDQMMAILDNPMMQQMMQQYVDSNPDAIRQMLEAQNPMFRQMFQGNPEMANNMVRQMMNPQALRSMLQMQRSMGGMPGMPTGANANASAGAGLDFSSLLGGAGQAPPDFSGMMQQMQTMFGGSGFGMQPPPAQQQHPSDRYRSQLNSLRDMGFDDEQQCLAVLQQHHGNLNRAVDALLLGPPVAAPAAAPAAAQAPSNDSTPQEPLPDPKNAQDKKDD